MTENDVDVSLAGDTLTVKGESRFSSGPADVRRWLEQEIAMTLGLHGAAIAPEPPSQQLTSRP